MWNAQSKQENFIYSIQVLTLDMGYFFYHYTL